MKVTKLLLSTILLITFFFVEPVNAQKNNDRLTVGYRGLGEIDAFGFTINKETTIKIEGSAGLFERMGNDVMLYGWILDGKTRKVVWNLLKEENDRFFRFGGDPGRFTFERELTLPAGDYEVYYAAGINNDNRNDFNIEFNLAELADLIFSTDERRDYRDERRFSKFSMSLIDDGKSIVQNDLYKNVNEFSNEAIASIVRAGDEEFIKKSFTVKKDIELNILGIGEQYDGEQFDFAWIVNAETYEKVWPNKSTRYLKAGGGRKNKMVSEKISLEKGDYTLYYISDGSHSYDKWNVLPPLDPQLWGISIWTDDKDQNKVKLTENADHFVLKLNKARDNDYLSQAFKIKKDMNVRVYSIGERSGRYDMADYGWIMNVDTHEKVWEFTERYSEYAGGGQKNRMINEEIRLEKGNYIAYYVTDGSHSYYDWNVAPPLIPDLWGLSILAENESKNFELVKSHDASDDNILAQIVRVRDNEYVKKRFTLAKESKLRIYAIGEGDNGKMHDLGWIKNRETGRIVWEMTYRNTESAGGARKNKLFNGSILLPAGEYTVYYETDGSHSFRDWNASAPHDQEYYGISVFLISN